MLPEKFEKRIVAFQRQLKLPKGRAGQGLPRIQSQSCSYRLGRGLVQPVRRNQRPDQYQSFSLRDQESLLTSFALARRPAAQPVSRPPQCLVRRATHRRHNHRQLLFHGEDLVSLSTKEARGESGSPPTITSRKKAARTGYLFIILVK